MKLLFLTIFLITFFASSDQVLIFPFVKTPEDLPWPEYSKLKKPIFFLWHILKKFEVFFPQYQT